MYDWRRDWCRRYVPVGANFREPACGARLDNRSGRRHRMDYRGSHRGEAAAMSKQDYLVLGMAAVFVVTNFLGAAFTIRRLRARRTRYSARAATAEHSGRAAAAE